MYNYNVLFPLLLHLCNIIFIGTPLANAASTETVTKIITDALLKSDQIFAQEIEGNFSILKYKLLNATLVGYKNCEVHNVRGDLNKLTLHFEVDCPGIHCHGQYEISGRLIILPVEGNGDFQITTGRYYSIAETELKKVQGDDGKLHLSIKNFKLNNEAREPIKFQFENLFNGNKELSDTLHKFAHENWREVSDMVQDPLWYTSMKTIISNTNKHLKTVPMDEVIFN